jgi:predicted RNase H-like HicB family nuclease
MNELIKKLTGYYNDALVYVAAPYTAKTAEGKEDVPAIMKRMETFSLCLEQMVKVNIKPTSGLMMHLVRCYTTDLPGDWKFWGGYSTVILKKCNYLVVLMMEGWNQSTGVKEEIAIAKDEGIDIIYLHPDQVLKGEFEDMAQYVNDHKMQEFPRPEGVSMQAIGRSTRSSIEYDEPEQEKEETNKKLTIAFPAIFKKVDNGYVVTFRDIPEAITQGDDDKDAMEMAEDALATAFDFYFEDKRIVPDPSPAQEGERMVNVSMDMAVRVAKHNLAIFTKRSQH